MKIEYQVMLGKRCKTINIVFIVQIEETDPIFGKLWLE